MAAEYFLFVTATGSYRRSSQREEARPGELPMHIKGGYVNYTGGNVDYSILIPESISNDDYGAIVGIVNAHSQTHVQEEESDTVTFTGPSDQSYPVKVFSREDDNMREVIALIHQASDDCRKQANKDSDQKYQALQDEIYRLRDSLKELESSHKKLRTATMDLRDAFVAATTPPQSRITGASSMQ
jgi:hypothetical protein